MTKAIKELKPGETFIDSLGERLKVEKIVELPWSGIPRTTPQVRVYFETPRGNHMYMNFRADRQVNCA